MLRFLDRHKFGLLGTILFHFFLYFFATFMYLPNNISEVQNILVIDFPNADKPEIEKIKEEIVSESTTNNNTNKAVNEFAPENIKKGNYNEYNNEPNEASKVDFEKKIEQELKNLEKQVIQEQREAGYGYTQEQINKMLSSNKNSDLNNIPDQKPRSESVISENTNITYKLKNRFDTKLSVPVYMCQYGGVIVVNIAVAPSGKVVTVKVDTESSKTTDQCLVKAALNSAKNTRFNSSNKLNKIQTGSITYRFINQ